MKPNTCQFCDQPVDPRWATHCDFHFALGTYFQYECDDLWLDLRGRKDFAKAFDQAFENWMNELTQEEKNHIYHVYWKGEKITNICPLCQKELDIFENWIYRTAKDGKEYHFKCYIELLKKQWGLTEQKDEKA